jgi:hypothetical protein
LVRILEDTGTKDLTWLSVTVQNAVSESRAEGAPPTAIAARASAAAVRPATLLLKIVNQ